MFLTAVLPLTLAVVLAGMFLWLPSLRRRDVRLAWRNHGAGEDPRCQAMRRHQGDRVPLVSLGSPKPGYADCVPRTPAFLPQPPA